MKGNVLSVIILIIAVVIFFSFGYKYVPFLKNFGEESYSGEISGVKAQSDESKEEVPISVEKERTVTHIKTPENVKAVYMSSWVAGTPSVREKIIGLIERTELNAVVIDVKDNTGVLSWDGRIKDLDNLIDELHSKNIYIIARIAAFQDPLYVKNHKDQAVMSKKTGDVWRDHKGVPWVDTGSKEMWKYIEEIGKESYKRGFDEINLDYIRFPTDGVLSDMLFPISKEDGQNNKPKVVAEFYEYITDSFRKDGIPVSGDLFGIIMTTDVDIKTLGQDMHVALRTFDYVAPMIYPSHFYKGTAGFDNPAKYPGEIIKYSMEKGLEIADEVASSTGMSKSSVRAKYRPWYQDFDMGATYTADMVRAQITAGEALGINSWMLWDPANKYTEGALLK